MRVLKEFDFFYSTLQTETSFIDFAHVRSLLLGHNDEVLKQKSTIQRKKLLKAKKPQHNPEKIIFNYCSYVLSEAEKSVLLKGLVFRLKNLIMLITLSIFNYFTEKFVTFRFFLEKI